LPAGAIRAEDKTATDLPSKRWLFTLTAQDAALPRGRRLPIRVRPRRAGFTEEPTMRVLRVLLLSTYDLGRQPFALASPAAWLREEGH